MRFTTEPMMVLDYGVWDIDGKPVTNKAGEPAEYVQLLDLGADEIHRFTLRDVPNSARPQAMSYAVVTCEARTAQKGREDGSVTSRLKVQVVGLEKASAPASTPSAASKS